MPLIKELAFTRRAMVGFIPIMQYYLSPIGDDDQAGYPYFLSGPSLFEENGGNIASQKLPLNTLVTRDNNCLQWHCPDVHQTVSWFLKTNRTMRFHLNKKGPCSLSEVQVTTMLANDFFIGDLDDIGVWNRCLSPCEICGIHNSMLASTMVDAGPDVTVCQGDSVILNATGALGAYTWSNGIVDGSAFAPDSSGYVYVESGGDECSITDSLFLDVAVPSEGVDVQFGCDSLTWIDGVTYTESTNGPTAMLANEAGCDSLVTLDLTVNYTTYSTLDTTVINVLEYYGEEYTEDGEYTVYLENQAGCDSIVTVKLTVEYVGLDEIRSRSFLLGTVFPNPAQDQLHHSKHDRKCRRSHSPLRIRGVS